MVTIKFALMMWRVGLLNEIQSSSLVGNFSSISSHSWPFPNLCRGGFWHVTWYRRPIRFSLAVPNVTFPHFHHRITQRYITRVVSCKYNRSWI